MSKANIQIGLLMIAADALRGSLAIRDRRDFPMFSYTEETRQQALEAFNKLFQTLRVDIEMSESEPTV